MLLYAATFVHLSNCDSLCETHGMWFNIVGVCLLFSFRHLMNFVVIILSAGCQRMCIYFSSTQTPWSKQNEHTMNS